MRNPIIKIFFIGIMLVTFLAGQITFADQSASVAIRVTVVSPQPSERMYIYLNGQRIASKDSSGKKYFYHNDHLGGTSVITDESGQEVKRVDYWPYGLVKEESGAKPENHLFTGKEFDAETGLYFYGARYYDPNLCRFISADSSGRDPSNPQKFNRYSYCLNNPLIYTDPSGNDETTAISVVKLGVNQYYGTLTGKDVAILTGLQFLKTVAPRTGAGIGSLLTAADVFNACREGVAAINAQRQASDAGIAWEVMKSSVDIAKIIRAKLANIGAGMKESARRIAEVIRNFGLTIGSDNDESPGESSNEFQGNSGQVPSSTTSASTSSNTQASSVASAVRGGAYIVKTAPGTVYDLMEHNPQFAWGNIQREYKSGLTWTSYDSQAFRGGYLGITRPVQGPGSGWQSQTSYFGHAIHSGLDQWTTDSVLR